MFGPRGDELDQSTTREHLEVTDPVACCSQTSLYSKTMPCGNVMPCSNPAHREQPTDPLREALERIADIAQPGREVGIGMWTDVERIAREALASSPEPEWEYRISGTRPARNGLIRWVEGSLRNAQLCAESMRATGHSDVVIERAPRILVEWEALPDD